MATEKTSLLQTNLILPEKTKVKECMVVLSIPKQITNDEEDSWSGLTRDQLISYVDDPFWCALRKIFMIVFWILLFLMFTSAVVIASVEHNGICTPKSKMINIKGIQNAQSPVGVTNSLSLIDESNLTASLAT